MKDQKIRLIFLFLRDVKQIMQYSYHEVSIFSCLVITDFSRAPILFFFLLLDIFVHQFDSKIVFRVYDNSRFLKEVFLASILHHKASKFILQLWCSLIWCTIFLHVITKLMRIISPKLPRFILITYKYDFI